MTLPDDPELPFKNPDPNFVAPTEDTEAVEGWRVWRCKFNPRKYEAEMPKLFSVSETDYYWWPRRAAQAQCSKCGDDLPGEACSCGFYTARSLEHLMSMTYHHYNLEDGYKQINVLGRIANWGKVIECSQGWRSQFAYPIKLWVPFEGAHLAANLEKTYGVPVKLKNILGVNKPNSFLAPNPRRRPSA